MLKGTGTVIKSEIGTRKIIRTGTVLGTGTLMGERTGTVIGKGRERLLDREP